MKEAEEYLQKEFLPEVLPLLHKLGDLADEFWAQIPDCLNSQIERHGGFLSVVALYLGKFVVTHELLHFLDFLDRRVCQGCQPEIDFGKALGIFCDQGDAEGYEGSEEDWERTLQKILKEARRVPAKKLN